MSFDWDLFVKYLVRLHVVEDEKVKKHAPFVRVSIIIFGGELEIRTPAGLASPIGFQDRPLQPLG